VHLIEFYRGGQRSAGSERFKTQDAGHQMKKAEVRKSLTFLLLNGKRYDIICIMLIRINEFAYLSSFQFQLLFIIKSEK
jgi:hypothetical protein